MLILNHREKSQRDLFGLQASVEHVEIQYKKNASAVGWKRKADEAFTPGISVKATVRGTRIEALCSESDQVS